MSTPHQARQPAGSPVGGQFAATQRAEADGVDLATGSGSFPAVEEMDATALMAYLNPRRGHPAAPAIVSAEYPDEALRTIAVRIRDYDAEHGPWEPPVRDPIDAYTEERDALAHEYAIITEGYEHLDPDERETRYAAVAEHFEAVARDIANDYEPADLPNPGSTRLSGRFGRLAGAAEAAATARASMYGRPDPDTVASQTDHLIDKALDTRDVTAANGIPFRMRLVRKGTAYGRDGTLTADQDMVFVFDARYPDFDPVIGHATEDRATTERNGQHVAHYYDESLRDHQRGAGLSLAGGVPDWSLDGATCDHVLDWLDRRAPLRTNEFAHFKDPEMLAIDADRERKHAGGLSDLAAASRRLAQIDEAYTTRRREIDRGWDSVHS